MEHLLFPESVDVWEEDREKEASSQCDTYTLPQHFSIASYIIITVLLEKLLLSPFSFFSHTLQRPHSL